jgi:hypothetical protein
VRWFAGLFLVAHGVLHMVIWIMPTPADAPFDAHHSPILGNVRVVSILLAGALRNRSGCRRGGRSGALELVASGGDRRCRRLDRTPAAHVHAVVVAGACNRYRHRCVVLAQPCQVTCGLAVHESGPSGAPSLVLLRGVGADASMWATGPPLSVDWDRPWACFPRTCRASRKASGACGPARFGEPSPGSEPQGAPRHPVMQDPRGARHPTARGLRGPASAEQLRPKMRPRPMSSARWTDEERLSALVRPAEDAGFEPARACTQPAFQASAIGL